MSSVVSRSPVCAGHCPDLRAAGRTNTHDHRPGARARWTAAPGGTPAYARGDARPGVPGTSCAGGPPPGKGHGARPALHRRTSAPPERTGRREVEGEVDHRRAPASSHPPSTVLPSSARRAPHPGVRPRPAAPGGRETGRRSPPGCAPARIDSRHRLVRTRPHRPAGCPHTPGSSRGRPSGPVGSGSRGVVAAPSFSPPPRRLAASPPTSRTAR